MSIVSGYGPTHAYFENIVAPANKKKNEMSIVNIVFIVWAYAIFLCFFKYENDNSYCVVRSKNKLNKCL